MSCFKFPSSILDEVEKIIRRFWWGSKISRGISRLSWARLCRPKLEGGMGFLDMASFNLALLTKQACRIITSPDLLLSTILKDRYFPSSLFFDMEKHPTHQATPRSRIEEAHWQWREYFLLGRCLAVIGGIRKINHYKAVPFLFPK